MTLSSHSLLKNISRDIPRRLIRKFANGSEPIPPNLVESLTAEQRAALVSLYQLLIIEAEIKKVKMVMRTLILLAILAASVVGELGPSVSQLLKELSQMLGD